MNCNIKFFLWLSLIVGITFSTVFTHSATKTDYSNKASVRVSDLMIKPTNSVADTSWKSKPERDVIQVDINILGNQIDVTTLRSLKPDAQRMNTRKLRRILGENFDNEWMSISPITTKHVSSFQRVHLMDQKLVEYSLELNFTFTDNAGAMFHLQPQLVSMFRNWLVQQASCPIDYMWEDLGHLFWPRYVKRGRCIPSYQCSWPPGMKCRSSHSRSLKLLNWKCSKMEESDQSNNGKMSNFDDEDTKAVIVTHRRQVRSVLQNKSNDLKRGRHSWETREERKERRKRRLIRKMSLSVNGHYCRWVIQQYVVNDKCSCLC